ncbi:MAG TPA: MBL fold metallo-hydrolase [Candidatus Saccharimonadia bacterium]|nr:MBL fold metallo-hydrolase [Candidatus Saccharimonadia bacterium]
MKITKLGHACLVVEEGEAQILIDPGAYSQGFEGLRELDAVLVTHQHADHVTPEALAKIRQNNPGIAVYADEGTVEVMAGRGDVDVKPVHAGEEFDVAGVKVKVFGSDHAVIHPTIPGIENVGYMIAARFFYPGDNFTQPGDPVEVLALPFGAPWLKVSEVIDYVMAVKPLVAIPVHDAVLAIPQMNVAIVKRFTDPASIELRVVENGTTTEV